MIKSDKVIPIYPNGTGIFEVIEELNKGARELGKLTLDEQMERIVLEKLRSGEIGKRNRLLDE